jgi:CubicO group peptidase (beta-lactamase class C family)
MQLKHRLDSRLKKATDSGDVPGVVALATNRDRNTYEGAFGKRILGQDAAMTTDTVVWIASMTKALTSACAMQLVEQGKLDLESSASKWVPDLAAVEVLEGFDAAGKPRTRKPKRPITLRHLLTHTAGFSYEIWSGDIQRYQQIHNLPGITTCQNAALRTPLLFDPGERWDYGINIDFVGKAAEAVSGKKLSAVMKENVLDPLGMSDTGFKITPSVNPRPSEIHSAAGRRGTTHRTGIPQGPG